MPIEISNVAFEDVDIDADARFSKKGEFSVSHSSFIYTKPGLVNINLARSEGAKVSGNLVHNADMNVNAPESKEFEFSENRIFVKDSMNRKSRFELKVPAFILNIIVFLKNLF